MIDAPTDQQKGHSRRASGTLPPDIPEAERVTVSQVTDAVAAVMESSNSAGVADRALASTIAGNITQSVSKAVGSRVGSGAELVGMTAFRNILSQHLGSPSAGYVEAETRKALERTLELANRSGSEFASAVAQGMIRLAALNVSGDTARDVARAEGRRTSTDFSYAFAGGAYTASNLSAAMRSFIDPAQGVTAAHVAGAANYATSIGIGNPSQYMGYFVGASDTVRNAIRDHIDKGAKLTDEHVKKSQDVKAILGAIKAGKIKPEDAPPSVRQVIEDMQKKGVDPATADPKAIDNYFKDNPKALDAAKQAAQEYTDKRAGLTEDQKRDQNIAIEKKRGATSAPSASAAKPPDRPPSDGAATEKTGKPKETSGPPRAASTLGM